MKMLNEKEWNNYLMPDIFKSIKRGKRLKKADHVEGLIPYVSSTANNNGVDGYIEAVKGTRVFEDCISLANSGSVGKAFYEPFKFVASDHVTSLKNESFDESQYLFISSTIEKQGSNFNFNREINDARIKKMQIMLPVTDDGEPDYDYMSEYVQEQKAAMIAKYRDYAEKQIAEIGDYVEIPALDEKEWGVISIPKYFEINEPKQINKPELIYISAKKDNNGFKGFTNEPKSQFSKGSLTWNKIGDGGAGLAYYHDYCYAMDTINVMSVKPKIHLNKYLGNFIARGLSQYFGVFNHGHTLSKKRFEKTKVMLPVTDDGEPDFKYMEQYAKNMMLRKYRQYLIFLESQIV